MNDQDLKKIFKEMKHGEPSKLEVNRWKRAIRKELDRTPGEWLRLAAACVIGIVIGAAAFNRGPTEEKVDDTATIERVYVNIE